MTAPNEAGRGCELSELVVYKNKMYSFDDRTGIMFEIKVGAEGVALEGWCCVCGLVSVLDLCGGCAVGGGGGTH